MIIVLFSITMALECYCKP